MSDEMAGIAKLVGGFLGDHLHDEDVARSFLKDVPDHLWPSFVNGVKHEWATDPANTLPLSDVGVDMTSARDVKHRLLHEENQQRAPS